MEHGAWSVEWVTGFGFYQLPTADISYSREHGAGSMERGEGYGIWVLPTADCGLFL